MYNEDIKHEIVIETYLDILTLIKRILMQNYDKISEERRIFADGGVIPNDNNCLGGLQVREHKYSFNRGRPLTDCFTVKGENIYMTVVKNKVIVMFKDLINLTNMSETMSWIWVLLWSIKPHTQFPYGMQMTTKGLLHTPPIISNATKIAILNNNEKYVQGQMFIIVKESIDSTLNRLFELIEKKRLSVFKSRDEIVVVTPTVVLSICAYCIFITHVNVNNKNPPKFTRVDLNKKQEAYDLITLLNEFIKEGNLIKGYR